MIFYNTFFLTHGTKIAFFEVNVNKSAKDCGCGQLLEKSLIKNLIFCAVTLPFLIEGVSFLYYKLSLPPISLNYDPPLAKRAHQTATTPFIENYHIPTPIKSMQRDCVRKEVNYINFLNNFP